MSPMQVAQRITADEYLELALQEQRTELIDGLIVVTEPRLVHQILHGRLFRALDGWVQSAKGGGLAVSPLDVRLDDHNVYAPDLLWYSDARVPALDAPWPYALPDLAVEIRSPSTWRFDIGTKKSVYERESLRELWLVDGDAGVVLVFRRSNPEAPSFDVALELDRSADLTSPMLPGFALDVGRLFKHE